MKHILITTIAAFVLVGWGGVAAVNPFTRSKVIQELESRVKDMLELHNNAERKYMTREDFYDLAREKNSSEIL